LSGLSAFVAIGAGFGVGAFQRIGFLWVHGVFSCVGTIPATTLGQGLALALSGCCDWDDPASGAVGLLGLGAMCAKTNDLFSVCTLAQGAQGAGHVFGRLGWAN
jgi:hypothetical protein